MPSDHDLHYLQLTQQFFNIHVSTGNKIVLLTLKAPSKIVANDIQIFFFFSEKTSLDISCESSAKQTIYMKCQDLFSLKNKKKK